jgi:hypothetical protein
MNYFELVFLVPDVIDVDDDNNRDNTLTVSTPPLSYGITCEASNVMPVEAWYLGLKRFPLENDNSEYFLRWNFGKLILVRGQSKPIIHEVVFQTHDMEEATVCLFEVFSSFANKDSQFSNPNGSSPSVVVLQFRIGECRRRSISFLSCGEIFKPGIQLP